ncbi:sigma-70 family RNA polymerase sigma factor [Virgibacillus halodenitrificans]|nr:sigma-70 family RNA polymerase sigma factor [Virgibacillus halodenitrificans]
MEMWADKLIGEYEVGRKGLTMIKNELNPEIIEDKQDRKQINSMINDMSYSIEWMKKGRRPGNLRGIDRRSAYQRQVLVDVDLFPSLDIEPEEREIHEEEKRALYNILLDLSHRERQCFLLYQAQGFSMQEIADELNIKKPTVQKFIERAKNKIKRKLSCHTNVI